MAVSNACCYQLPLPEPSGTWDTKVTPAVSIPGIVLFFHKQKRNGAIRIICKKLKLHSTHNGIKCFVLCTLQLYIFYHYYQLTLAIHGDVTPTRHRTGEPPHWARCGQWDGSDCLGHLHWVEKLDQHDVKIQSLVVITAHREI